MAEGLRTAGRGELFLKLRMCNPKKEPSLTMALKVGGHSTSEG